MLRVKCRYNEDLFSTVDADFRRLNLCEVHTAWNCEIFYIYLVWLFLTKNTLATLHALNWTRLKCSHLTLARRFTDFYEIFLLVVTKTFFPLRRIFLRRSELRYICLRPHARRPTWQRPFHPSRGSVWRWGVACRARFLGFIFSQNGRLLPEYVCSVVLRRGRNVWFTQLIKRKI